MGVVAPGEEEEEEEEEESCLSKRVRLQHALSFNKPQNKHRWRGFRPGE